MFSYLDLVVVGPHQLYSCLFQTYLSNNVIYLIYINVIYLMYNLIYLIYIKAFSINKCMHSSQLIYVAQLYGVLTCSSYRGRVDAEANHGRESVGTVSWKSNSHYFFGLLIISGKGVFFQSPIHNKLGVIGA